MVWLLFSVSHSGQAAAIIQNAKDEAARIMKEAMEKAQGLIDAQGNQQLRKRPSDNFKTPDRRTSACTSPAATSNASPQSSGFKKQFSIKKFFGSQDDQDSQSPVLDSVQGARRHQHSKAMQALMEEKKKYAEATNALMSVDEAASKAIQMKLLKSRAGRPEGKSIQRSSNRALEGAKRRKLEFGAFEKMRIAEEVGKRKQSHASERGLWSEMRKLYGIPAQRVKDIYSKKDEWTHIVKKNKLGSGRGSAKGIQRKSSACIRSTGGGRKREYEDQIQRFRKWVALERSNGHHLSKRELLEEFCCYLTEHAQECMKRTQDGESASGSISSLTMQARSAQWKRDKLLDSRTTYGRNYTSMLIGWINAKFMQKELSHKISALESRARAQLTWQGIDRILYLMGAADEEELQESGIIANPSQVISNRHNMCITMSDQVPVWAKPVHTKMIFSEQELTGMRYDDKVNFKEVRKEIESAQQVMKMRQEQVITSAEGEGKDEKKLVSGMKLSHHNPHEEKFRITYEARQKIYGLVDGELTGEVACGLLVFAGPHQRLSNLDKDGKYKEDDEFEVGEPPSFTAKDISADQ